MVRLPLYSLFCGFPNNSGSSYCVAVDKDNQDAFAVLPNFGKSGTTDQAFMGVFDGHGRDGHHCARYVRDNVRDIHTLPRDTFNG
jgi:serine/threonine protein phosphatase PrpC